MHDYSLSFAAAWLSRVKRVSLRASWLPSLIIAVGAILRIAQYLRNRSLWLDECFLALAILGKSWRELLQPLGHNQAAPVGFVALQSLACRLLGDSEFVLRFIPLFGALVSLILFLRISQHILPSLTGITVAITLFSLSDFLIYYASEAKQYSTDVLVSLLCFLIVSHLEKGLICLRRCLVAGVVGAVAIWCAYPATFALAGVVAGLLGPRVVRKNWHECGRLGVAALLWVLSFAAYYSVSLRKASGNSALEEFWKHAFMPLPPWTVADIGWFVSAWQNLFGLLDVRWPFASVVAFVLGAYSLSKRHSPWLLVLVIPVIAALVASGLHKYPFADRLLLFAIPSLIILVAEGVQLVWQRSAILAAILVAALLYQPFINSIYGLVKSRVRAEYREAIAYVGANYRPGDVIYASWETLFAFEYYCERFGLTRENCLGEPPEERDIPLLIESLAKRKPPGRIWIIMSSVVDWRNPQGRTPPGQAYDFSTHAHHERSVEMKNATVHLYVVPAH